MSSVTIPKQEYNFLKKCEKIISEIKEDESLSEEDIKLIEEAKAGKRLSKTEFLDKFDKLQNA
jgi:hypothetical protein|tara:strand:- start:488 stop:676 length:189 start_codon:yes stop_codon:yes gene_type:complete